MYELGTGARPRAQRTSISRDPVSWRNRLPGSGIRPGLVASCHEVRVRFFLWVLALPVVITSTGTWLCIRLQSTCQAFVCSRLHPAWYLVFLVRVRVCFRLCLLDVIQIIVTGIAYSDDRKGYMAESGWGPQLAWALALAACRRSFLLAHTCTPAFALKLMTLTRCCRCNGISVVVCKSTGTGTSPCIVKSTAALCMEATFQVLAQMASNRAGGSPCRYT